MSKNSKKATPERKAALTQICDAESYVPIIRESLTDEQAKAHPPAHLANILSLAAELYLLYYDSIGFALATASDLAVTFTCKLSRDKDTVEISYLPIAKFKDSASAVVEDDSQPDLGDIKKEAAGRAPKPAKASTLRIGNTPAGPMNLPAPVTVDAEIVVEDETGKIIETTSGLEFVPALSDDDVKAFVVELENEAAAHEIPERIAKFVSDHGRDALERAHSYAADDDDISTSVYRAVANALAAMDGEPADDNSPEILV